MLIFDIMNIVFILIVCLKGGGEVLEFLGVLY